MFVRNLQKIPKPTSELINNSFLSVSYNIFKNLIKKDTPTKIELGRWALTHCPEKQGIINDNTTRDHCGDQICGNPEVLKEIYGQKNI